MRGIVSTNLTPFLKQVNDAIAQAKQENIPFQVSKVRENLEKLSSYMIEGPVIAMIKDVSFTNQGAKISARIYHPAPTQDLPVLLHFHGGGHMCGSIELYDPISRELAVAANAIVICVNYRLAPEHPYPCGLNDCQALLENYRELLQGYNHNDKLYIAGDSAGGAICTSLVMNNMNNTCVNIDKQILIYPSVDYTMSCPSIKENGQGFLLETDKINWYFQQYFNIENTNSTHRLAEENSKKIKNASPLFGDFHPSMPKTLVITAGCDPLRDEGMLYVEQAIQAGVSVDHYQFDELIHAYMLLSKLIPEQYHQTYLMIKKFINA
jgi:acetyl esterase/lipase